MEILHAILLFFTLLTELGGVRCNIVLRRFSTTVITNKKNVPSTVVVSDFLLMPI